MLTFHFSDKLIVLIRDILEKRVIITSEPKPTKD